jgi:hypothetical protein
MDLALDIFVVSFWNAAEEEEGPEANANYASRKTQRAGLRAITAA